MDIGPLILGGNAPFTDSAVFDQVRQKCHDKPKASRLQLGRSWTALLTTRVTPGGANKNPSNMHRMTFHQFAPLVVMWPALTAMALPSSLKKGSKEGQPATAAAFSLPDHESFTSICVFHTDYVAESSVTPEGTRGGAGLGSSMGSSIGSFPQSSVKPNHFPKYLQITATLELPASSPLKAFVPALLNDLVLCVVGNVTVLPPPVVSNNSSRQKDPDLATNAISFVGMLVQRPPAGSPSGPAAKGGCSVQMQFLLGAVHSTGKTLSESIVRNNFPQEFHPYLTFSSSIWKTIDGAVIGLGAEQPPTPNLTAATLAQTVGGGKGGAKGALSPKSAAAADPHGADCNDTPSGSASLISGELATQQLAKKRQEKSIASAAAAAATSDPSSAKKESATAASTVGGSAPSKGGKGQVAGAATVPSSSSTTTSASSPANKGKASPPGADPNHQAAKEEILANAQRLVQHAAELRKSAQSATSVAFAQESLTVDTKELSTFLGNLFRPSDECMALTASAAAQLGPESKMMKQAIASGSAQAMLDYLAFQATQLQNLLRCYRAVCHVTDAKDLYSAWTQRLVELSEAQSKEFTAIVDMERSQRPVQKQSRGRQEQTTSGAAGKEVKTAPGEAVRSSLSTEGKNNSSTQQKQQKKPRDDSSSSNSCVQAGVGSSAATATTTGSSSDLPSQDVSVGEISPPSSVRKEIPKSKKDTAKEGDKKAAAAAAAVLEGEALAAPPQAKKSSSTGGGAAATSSKGPSKQQQTPANASITSSGSSGSSPATTSASPGGGSTGPKKRSLLQDNRFMNIMAFSTAALLAALVLVGFTLVE